MIATNPEPTVSFTWAEPRPSWGETQATDTVFICTVNNSNTVKLGVHALALKDDLTVLEKYREVRYNREKSTATIIETIVDPSPTNTNKPLRYAIRTNPIKIAPRNR